MKKQRSASPSQAMPSSAPSDSTFSTMKRRFSGRSGFGSWSGKFPSGVQYVCTCSIGSRSSSGPAIGPAMPFPPSRTTFIGRDGIDVHEPRGGCVEVLGHVLALVAAARLDRRARLAAGHDLLQLPDPGVARQRDRAAPDELGARVRLRIVRGRAHQAAVEVARADGEIEHLRPHLADVEDVRALVPDAVGVALREGRRGEAHVAPETDAQVGRRLLLESRRALARSPARRGTRRPRRSARRGSRGRRRP